MASPAQVPDAAATRLVAEHAYEEMRDRIVTLALPPGTVLREDQLMGEMGIGRTPLREAVPLHVRETGVDLVLETRGEEHAAAILAALADAGYEVERFDGSGRAARGAT